MADREGIELARVGEFDLAIGGKQEFTAPMLIDAARRAKEQGDKFRAPLKLGHTDPRNDGEPAFGWLHNLRTSGDGADTVLLGDVTGMPDWLAQTAPSAYPDRSIEGHVIPAADGSKGLEINGLALLGVTPPAMDSIKTWRELPGFIAAAGELSVTSFAAAYQAIRDIPIEAASTKPWSDFSQADYTIEQWRRACLIKMAAASPNKADYKLPVREPSGAVNTNGVHAAASVLAGGMGGVQAPPAAQKAAAVTLVGLYKNELKETPPPSLLKLAGVAASASEPPAPPVIPNPKEADAMSDTLLQGLRERLGVDAELDDAGVLAALDSKIAAASAPVTPPPAAPALPEGSTVISKDALDELRIAAAAGAEARAKQLGDERDDTIRTAIAAGKIAPARREYWTTNWDKDPEGTKASIDELGVIYPIAASGRPGGGDVHSDEPFSDAEAAQMAALVGVPKEAFLA